MIAITKLSSFLWCNFHILNKDILVKRINFLHLKVLINQMCVRLSDQWLSYWSRKEIHIQVRSNI